MNSVIDEALERLRGRGMEMVDGMPNHGPMAAEALVALGRDEVVTKWVDRYCQRLDVLPAATSPITVDTWREALGDISRIADWTAFFRVQLAEAPWRAVFAEWIGRLLPATIAAGTHGLIRTAHALRALEDAETLLRVEELGVALAYWAAYYHRLPGTPRFAGALDLEQALGQVPRSMRGRERRGLPRELVLRVIDASPEFTAAVDRATEPESVEDALSTLTQAGAACTWRMRPVTRSCSSTRSRHRRRCVCCCRIYQSPCTRRRSLTSGKPSL